MDQIFMDLMVIVDYKASQKSFFFQISNLPVSNYGKSHRIKIPRITEKSSKLHYIYTLSIPLKKFEIGKNKDLIHIKLHTHIFLMI